MRFADRLIVNRTPNSLHLRCPAKVNLFLRVLGRRSDGYHEIQTVMQTVTLFDELRIQRQSSGITLICSHEELASRPEENLAFRAADLFLTRGHGAGGVRLELRKNIPIAAGLGGGSSDAACCLLALNELFGTALSPDDLRSMAAELGSDAPFFIQGGTALCTGRGEVIRQLPDAPRFSGILASPAHRLKTQEMYSLLTPEDFRGPAPESILRSIQSGNLNGLCSSLFNSFEYVALRMMPGLPSLKRKLQELGGIGCILCGSGPTILALFPGADEAQTAFRRLLAEKGMERLFAALVAPF